MPINPTSLEEENIVALEAFMEQKPAKLFSAQGIIQPLRRRNFALLFSGQLVSNIGDMFYAVALPWFMLSGGGGAQALGTVLAAYGIPRAASVLLGGVLSDRLLPRRIMLLTDAVRVFLMAALAAVIAQGHPTLWLLCLLSALLGLFSGLFIPASWAVTPSVLSGEELQAGNALITSSAQLAGVVGAGIAGAVVAWLQPAGTLALDALTFVISALTLFFIRDINIFRSTDSVHADVDRTEESSLTIWQLLRRSRLLQIMIILMVFMNLGNGAAFEVALPAFIHNQIHADASGYGFILAGFSVGVVIGAIVAGGLGQIPYRFLCGLACFFFMGILIWLLAYMGNIWIGVLIMLGAGVLNGLGNVIILTVVQAILPKRLMGRVMSVFAFANFGLYPFSVAIAGVLIPHYGTNFIFIVNGLLLIVPCIWGGLQRDFWRRDEVQLFA